MQHAESPVRPLTGRHMAMIFVGFFAVVIGVNLTMAMLARKSWTGLVVPNAYVASQHFNAETAQREAMLARGNRFVLSYSAGKLALDVTDRNGNVLNAASASLRLFHRVDAQDHVELTLSCGEGQCSSIVELSAGFWRGDMTVQLPGQDVVIQSVEILVKET